MNARQLKACANRLQEFLSTMLAGVGRAERRRHGTYYVQGLLLDGERKSIEPLAKRVPGAEVQALQQFVGQSPWAWEPVRRQMAQRMAQELRLAAAWIVDDTGFPKQGHHSVGVARQYSGTLGKVGNCQVAVTVHFEHCNREPAAGVGVVPAAGVDRGSRPLPPSTGAGADAVSHQAG